MARRDGILAAYKAMPGASSWTPSPQGTMQNVGQFSPAAQSMANEGGYARAYGPGFLPRNPATFTQGAFGPFSPILPVSVDQPAPGADMPDARLYQYMVGWNLPVGAPGAEGIKLADFGTLKTLADLYSVARACIEIRKNEICGLDWDIIPTKDAAKAYHGSTRSMKDFGDRRGQALKFFRKPDPDYQSFRTFMSSLLEEVFVFDALSLLIRPKRGKGMKRGVLGSDLDCLELISGPTMRPLVGMHGEVPRPPNPAYQQYLYGVPRSDYMTMINERDILEGGLTEAEINSWTTDQFLYLPMVPRRWTPYGFPPVERALIPVMSGLQKQAFQLDYFKEGTIPAVYVSPGDVNMTPNQIRELQDALNAFAGDPAWHHKVIVLPPGSKVDPQKPVDVADQFDDIVMTQVCMAFDVNPMELGILPKVAASATPSQVKQLAQSASSVHERLSTKPTLKYLADIFDSILHNVLGQDDMKFTFEGLQEDAEQGMLTDLLVQQVQSGIRSVDEARDQLELQPWGLDMTSGPVVFTAAGPIPFNMPPMLGPGQSQSQAGAQAATKKPPAANNAPLQQAGRQGGSMAPTPGHAQSAAANASARSSRSMGVSAPASGSVSSQKAFVPAAVKSELEALARHLNKGRRVTTWRNIHIPAHAMAVIAEDLTKGLTPDECTEIAKTILLRPGEDYEWLPKEMGPDGPWEALWGSYQPLVEAAFMAALRDIADLLRGWWAGEVMLTRQSLLDEARDIIAKALTLPLYDLWAEAWRINDETAGGYFESWAASHGRDAIEGISKSRLKKLAAAVDTAIRRGTGPGEVVNALPLLLDVVNRARMIVVTEMQRAATAAAVTRFTAQGVSYKIWQTRMDGKVCGVCKMAQNEGPIPLNSLFSNGLDGPPAHPNCRCSLHPAGSSPAATALGNVGSLGGAADAAPAVNPLANDLSLGKNDSGSIHGDEPEVTCERGHQHHGAGGAGLLIRHQGDDGKTRYLFQQRSLDEDEPGSWGFPGGGILEGETPLQGAFRESQEEMGHLPPGVTVHHHVVDDHGGWAWTTLVCDVDQQFTPDMSTAQTPDESAGFGWFTKEEVKKLKLHPAVAEAWDAVSRTRKNTEIGKCVMRRVNLDGQEIWESPDPCPCHSGDQAAGGGGPEFMPHDENGIQDGRASGSRGGGTGGHTDDAGSPRPQPPSPEWEDDGEYPHERGLADGRYSGDLRSYAGGAWPQGGHGTQQAGTSSPGRDARRGIGKAEALDELSALAEKGVLAAAMADAAPKVMAQLEENFPPEALAWVSEARWAGPLLVPLRMVDFSDMKSWAAWHEQDRVDHFKHLIQAGEKFNPIVLVKVPGHKHYRAVDGHHRTLAYKQLGKPLLAWIGVISFGLEHAALETHSSQYHSGNSPQNG